MKTIYNNTIPFKGFLAMSVWPFVFVRRDVRLNVVTINHEHIHGEQQKEITATMFVLLISLVAVGVLSWWWILTCPLWYYAFYGLEFVFRLFLCRFDIESAYRNVSFEQEAYIHQSDLSYIKKRNPYASFGYVGRKTFIKSPK